MFKSTLHAIYCKCECADAAMYVTKTINFTTKDWSQAEKIRFHSELQDPKWSAHDLRWPVAPPVASPAAAPDSGDYAGGDPASTTIRSHTMTYSRTARHSSGAVLTCDR